MDAHDIVDEIASRAESRFVNFAIKPNSTLRDISTRAPLEVPTWLGGDEKFICLFIDLDDSSKLSLKKHARTMAKVYDYFTQSLVDVFKTAPFSAEYIDVKGDGAFALFEGNDAVYRAFCAGVTFRTFFENFVADKFKDEEADVGTLHCKSAIHLDKILIRRIGKRGASNSNEVWAGRLINKTAALASLCKDIEEKVGGGRNRLVASPAIYKILERKREHAIESCEHSTEKGGALWREYSSAYKETAGEESVWYLESIWCKECGDEYMASILS